MRAARRQCFRAGRRLHGWGRNRQSAAALTVHSGRSILASSFCWPAARKCNLALPVRVAAAAAHHRKAKPFRARIAVAPGQMLAIFHQPADYKAAVSGTRGAADFLFLLCLFLLEQRAILIMYRNEACKKGRRLRRNAAGTKLARPSKACLRTLWWEICPPDGVVLW